MKTRKKTHSTIMVIIVIVAIALSVLLIHLSSENQNAKIAAIGLPIVITLAASSGYTYHRVYKMSNVDREELATNYCEEDKFELTLSRDVFVRSVTTSEKISDK